MQPGSTEPLFDAVIVGGGIAGLWLLHRLNNLGYDALLLEATSLGGGQTLAAQGIIHSGLKYGPGSPRGALRDGLGSMPSRWRACLSGSDRPCGDPDLRGLTPIADPLLLFSNERGLDRLRSLIASRLLAAQTQRLKAPPQALQDLGFRGVVYAVDEFVLALPALLQRLRAPVADRLRQQRLVAAAVELPASANPGSTTTEGAIRLQLDAGPVRAQRLILCAGAGNAALIDGLALRTIRQRVRPLHQVVVRHSALPALFGHCVSGVRSAEPRLTISSHRSADESAWDWYLGGRLATTGVPRNRAQQIVAARAELQQCLPGFHWDDAHFDTLVVDRAEPETPGTGAYVMRDGAVLAGWPMKLTLAPDFADKVLAELPPPLASREGKPAASTTAHAQRLADTSAGTPAGTRPAVGILPWHRR